MTIRRVFTVGLVCAGQSFVLAADAAEMNTEALSARLGGGVRYIGTTLSISGSGSLTTSSYTAFGDCFTGNRRNVFGTASYRF